MKAARGAASVPTACGDAAKGDILFFGKRISPLHPQEKGRGESPSTPDIAGLRLEELHALRNVSAVYMASPWIFCESLPLSHAPYYREARVTVVRRQTACGMRHCCARRIVECSVRRKLVCTSTRWAERHPQGVYRIRKAAKPPTAAQQRIVGANQIVSQHPMRQRRAQGSAIGKRRISSSCSLAMAGSRGRAPCVLLGV